MIYRHLNASLAALLLATFSYSVDAQSNIVRANTAGNTNIYIPALSTTTDVAQRLDENGDIVPPEPKTFVINNNHFTIPSGIVKMADGTILDSSQVSRLQSIIDNNSQQYLGLVASATAPLLDQAKSSKYSRTQELHLPSRTKISHSATVTLQPVTWSKDTDTAKFVFYSIENETKTSHYDSGHANWNSTGWHYDAVLRDVEITVPAQTDSVEFFGECIRKTGSYCSAIINQAYVTFNADLPSFGETITIEPAN
jgi:hypothetical protein